ncbi:unnamed protein product, partial [Lymnaea stagnalis]
PRGPSLPSSTPATSPLCLKINTPVPGSDKQATSTLLTTPPHFLNSQPATSIPLIPKKPKSQKLSFRHLPVTRPPPHSDSPPACEPSQLLNFETQFEQYDNFMYLQESDSSSSFDGWSVSSGDLFTSDQNFETYY